MYDSVISEELLEGFYREFGRYPYTAEIFLLIEAFHSTHMERED